MEKKTFKTLTIRELDSLASQDIVEIINEVIPQYATTGQSALEYIVRDYKRLKTKVQIHEQEKIEYREKFRVLQRDLKDKEEIISTFQKALKKFLES